MARWSLRGRAILVTGAAGGIGAALARELVRRGARPALLDLDAAGVRELAASVGAFAIEADVADRDSVGRGVAEAVERLGALDAVVATAGVAPVGSLRTMPPAEVERAIEVNLLGTWWTLRAALPHVLEARGYLLAVSSLAAPVQVPLTGAYAAAKAGVDALATTLRLELAHDEVAVGVATFGWIDTPMVRAATADPGAALLRGRARGPLATDHPPERAARAVVRGIERRARTVAYPWWVKPVLALGPLAQRVAELELRRAGPEAVRRSEELRRAPLDRRSP